MKVAVQKDMVCRYKGYIGHTLGTLDNIRFNSRKKDLVFMFVCLFVLIIIIYLTFKKSPKHNISDNSLVMCHWPYAQQL